MELENVVVDASDPHRLGAFWAALLGAEVGYRAADTVEARVTVPGGPWFDVCLSRVPDPVLPDPRLHLDLAGGADQGRVVERALALGARPLDIGQGDVPWVVLADPEGNPFCVMEHRDAYVGTGPVAALPLDSADPERDLGFWATLTGWRPEPGGPLVALRHPSGRGPLLELCPERAPRMPGTKNRLHLDVRLGPDDDLDTVLAAATDAGGTRVDHDWGDLPWTVLEDPSGNALCVLPARR